MNLVSPFLFGIGAGILMSVLLGAIFFLLINKSLTNGPKTSFAIASGVIVVDATFVTLAIVFTQKIHYFLQSYQSLINMAGACFLIAFGLYQLKFPIKENNNTMASTSLFLTAFTINALNPANAAWWLGLFSINPMLSYSFLQKWIFGFSALISIFFTEVGIAYSAVKLKKFLSAANLLKLNMWVAIGFIGLGIKLVFEVFW